jgi:hypothetical protein
VSKLREQTNEATMEVAFCFSIQLSPVALGLDRNGCSLLADLRLLLVMILIGVNDPIAEHGGCQINIFT